MEKSEREGNLTTKKKGLLYFLKKLFNYLPVETNIKTPDGVYDVEIKISVRKMKKIVDEICLNALFCQK